MLVGWNCWTLQEDTCYNIFRVILWKSFNLITSLIDVYVTLESQEKASVKHHSREQRHASSDFRLIFRIGFGVLLFSGTRTCSLLKLHKKYCRRTIIPRNRHSSLHVCPQKSIFHVSLNSNTIDIGNSNRNISSKCSQDKKNISCSKNNVELRKRKANIYASGSCWGTCMLQKSHSCVHLNLY